MTILKFDGEYYALYKGHLGRDANLGQAMRKCCMAYCRWTLFPRPTRKE